MNISKFNRIGAFALAALAGFGPAVADEVWSPDAEGMVRGVAAIQRKAQILWTRTICEEQDKYCGWPTLCRRANGELLVAFSGNREHHVCPYGQVHLIRSSDGGVTWSAPSVAVDDTIDDRDGGITELANGDLLLTTFTSIAFSGVEEYKEYYKTIPQATIDAELGYFSYRSTDGGLTWMDKFRMAGTTPHGCIQLKDGRLMMIGQAANYTTHSQQGIVCEVSSDNGKSWTVQSMLPMPDGMTANDLCEPSVIELKSGRLIAHIRHEAVDKRMFQSVSEDGGLTWSAMTETAIETSSHPSQMIELDDGRIVCSYARRLEDAYVFIVISYDGGETWDVDNRIRLTRSWDWDFGYPTTVRLDDGSFLTAYYICRNSGDAHAVVMATRWRLLGGSETPLDDALAIRLKSDAGLATNAQGQVTAWKNQGVCGADFDVYPASGAASAGVTVVSSGAGAKPSVVFDGTDYLASTNAAYTGMNTEGGAWFVVHKVAKGSAVNTGLMGHTPETAEGTRRMGAFAIGGGGGGSTIRWRGYFCAGTGSPNDLDVPVGAWQDYEIHSHATDATTMSTIAFCDGTSAASPTSHALVTPVASKLNVGKFISWSTPLVGEIAELRFYSRPLTGTERTRVELELAADYALSLPTLGERAVAAWAECPNDLQVAGYAPHGAEADVVTNVTCGGLVFAFDAMPEKTVNSIVPVSHDGAEGADRSWWIGGGTEATALAAKLSVAASDYTAASKPALFRCAGGSTAWTLADAEPQRVGDRLVFALAANWTPGVYKVMDNTMGSLALWFRADQGLATNAAGQVTAWANRGLAGSAFDVFPNSGAASTGVVAGTVPETDKPCLVFNGTDSLISPEAADLGVSSAGGTWFVVNRTDHTLKVNAGLFGYVPSDAESSHRMGAFCITSWTAEHLIQWRSYFCSSQNLDPLVPWDAWCTYCLTSSPNGSQMDSAVFIDDGVPSGDPAATHALATPKSARLRIGSMLSWTTPLVGEIAELRFYSRPLTVSERTQVNLELAARYGLPVSTFGDNAKAMLATHGEEIRVMDAATTSALSGGLTLSYAATPEGSDVRTGVSHDGATGTGRSWWIGGGTDARANALTLAFDAATYVGIKRLALFFRASASEAWAVVATAEKGACTFNLAANWSSGEYKVMDRLDSALALWLRTDLGMTTNELGQVVSWANQGTAGSVLDVAPASGAASAGLVVTPNAYKKRAAVTFDGTDFLQSAGTSDAGLTTSGGTLFIVQKPSTATVKGSSGLLSLTAEGDVQTHRLGAFCIDRASGPERVKWRCYFNAPNGKNADAWVDCDAWTTVCIGSSNDSGTMTTAALTNGAEAASITHTAQTPHAAPLQVGNFVSWKAYSGDIAEVRLYNRPLSESERREIEQELRAWYAPKLGFMIIIRGQQPREVEQQTLWACGDDDVAYYRIPTVCTAPNGDIVAAVDARVDNVSDSNCGHPIHIAIRRSTDGGKTWGPTVSAWDWPWDETAEQAASDASFIVDRTAGKIFLFCNVNDWKQDDPSGGRDSETIRYRHYVQESSDNGVTWSAPKDITESLAVPGWTVYGRVGTPGAALITGGNGIQTSAGLLLHTLYKPTKPYGWEDDTAIFGSDDHGVTWKAMGNPIGLGSENKVVELGDGSWMDNSRLNIGSRRVHVSTDNGATWTTKIDTTLLDAACNAALMRHGDNLLFSNCNSTKRENVCVRVSRDWGATWEEPLVLWSGEGAYSEMTILPNGDVGVIYEKGVTGDPYRSIAFAIVPREKLGLCL